MEKVLRDVTPDAAVGPRTSVIRMQLSVGDAVTFRFFWDTELRYEHKITISEFMEPGFAHHAEHMLDYAEKYFDGFVRRAELRDVLMTGVEHQIAALRQSAAKKG